MASANDQNLFRYLTGELTFHEWNELQKEKQTRSSDQGDLAISLQELTVIAKEDGSAMLTTAQDEGGSVARLQGVPPSGLPTVVATGSSDGSSATMVDLNDQRPLTIQDTRTVPGTDKIQVESAAGSDDVEITEVSEIFNVPPIPHIKEEPQDPTEDEEEEEEEDEDDDDVVIIDPETTMRYLTGDMPFEEFSKILDQQIKEEDIAVEPTIDDVAYTVEITGDDDTAQDDVPDATASTSQENPMQASPKEKKKRSRKTRLPKHLQGLMGEANVKFARNEHDEAIKMCMEVIRLVPTATEPFQTLGMLYEEKGDMEKALQFFLIAAHLNPSDSEEWVRLAEMSLEQGNATQAISCYDKAIRYDSRNMDLLWARCDLYEKQGDKSKALLGYQELLKLIPKEQSSKYYQLARDVCKAYHELGQPENAVSTMEEAFRRHPESISAEDVNLLLELSMNMKEYRKPIGVLIEHCGLELTLPDGKVLKGNGSGPMTIPDDLPNPTEASIPEQFPIDLRIKLAICLIYLRYLECHHEIVSALLAESPEEVGDLYLDVAEAYMDCGDYDEAKPYLINLVHSEKYHLAAVWLRFGECLNALGELQAAAQAYENVVVLAPSHMEARVRLSALKQQLGEHDEALRILDHEGPHAGECVTGIDLRLMLPRCSLLYSQGRIDEFVDCSVQVLFGHFRDIFKKSHLSLILNNRSIKHRIYALRCVIGSNLDQRIKEASCMLSEHSVVVEDLWELYMKLCQVLIEQKRFGDLMELSITALMSPLFMNDTNRALETDFICLTACLLNRTSHFAYNFIREICVKQLNNNRAWNLFTQIISLSQDIRHNRYCLRLIIKHPDHYALGVLNGHNAMVAGSYKHALGEYVCAFRRDTENPLIVLCIGNTFVHMACQKFSTCRHSLIVQGCAFLNHYMEMRGECQETYYNMGRALHQLGILSAAIHCYEKALEFGPPTDEDSEIFDLSREIAFNLALIYKASKSYDLASIVVQRYLVV